MFLPFRIASRRGVIAPRRGLAAEEGRREMSISKERAWIVALKRDLYRGVRYSRVR
jgi:hypothetical protein